MITTTRAYNDLEKEGYITSVQGKGSIVLPKDNEVMKERYLMRIEEGVMTAIHTAQYIGMEEEEFHNLVSSLWKEMEE